MVKTKHKATRTENSIFKSVAIGVAAGMVVSMLLLLLLTSLVMNGSVGEDRTQSFIFAIRAVGGFAGCMLATVAAKKQHLLVSGVTAGIYLIALLAVGIVFYEGSFADFGSGLLSVLIGCGIACISRLKPPAKGKYKRHIGR